MAKISMHHDISYLSQSAPVVRKIGMADLWDALAKGYDDFRDTPTQLVFLAIIYPIVALFAGRAAATGSMLELFYPLVAGLSLMGPLVSVGVYELSRRREQGLPVSWVNAFDVIKSPSLFSIGIMGGLMCFIFLAWLTAAEGIFLLTVGPLKTASIGEFVWTIFNTQAGLNLLLLGNFVGFLFAALVLTLTAVSFPLLLDRDVGPLVAIQTSIRAMRVNPLAMIVWGLIVAVILFIACLPLFIGLAVAMPVLGHATWHLYRKIVAH